MDKKRKIVFLSEFVGNSNRGVETYVIELQKRLPGKFEVEVLTGKDAYSIEKIIGGHYDVVIATNGRLQALKASLGRLFGKYQLIIPGQAGPGKDDIWNIAVCCPDYYIGLTQAEVNWAQKYAWKSKIVKIPNGVDLDKFSPSGKKISLGLKGKVVLSVGALFWYKYQDRTIKALRETDLSLLIIGKGPEKERLEKLGREYLGKDRFKIIEVDFEDIPTYYRSADLFVLPSWDRESFGIVYLEAMASGLPVVAPDDLSRKEIVGEGGLLTDVSNIDKYREIILQALSQDWKDKPRKQAGKFSWDKIANQYEKLFLSL